MVGFDRFRNALWECECDCGEAIVVNGCHLRNGNTKSCGCWKHDEASQRMRTHGLGGDPNYLAWWHMMNRCYDETNKRYPRYGGRGIVVCEMLRSSPVNVIALIGPRPYRGLTLDRIVNGGNYSCGQCAQCLQNHWPINIRWATYAEQNRNTCRNRIIEIEGRRQCMMDWANEMGMTFGAFRGRFQRGAIPGAVEIDYL